MPGNVRTLNYISMYYHYPNSPMRRLTHRGAKYFTQSHTTSKWQSEIQKQTTCHQYDIGYDYVTLPLMATSLNIKFF